MEPDLSQVDRPLGVVQEICIVGIPSFRSSYLYRVAVQSSDSPIFVADGLNLFIMPAVIFLT